MLGPILISMSPYCRLPQKQGKSSHSHFSAIVLCHYCFVLICPGVIPRVEQLMTSVVLQHVIGLACSSPLSWTCADHCLLLTCLQLLSLRLRCPSMGTCQISVSSQCSAQQTPCWLLGHGSQVFAFPIVLLPISQGGLCWPVSAFGG